jgi:hypothetical protein
MARFESGVNRCRADHPPCPTGPGRRQQAEPSLIQGVAGPAEPVPTGTPVRRWTDSYGGVRLLLAPGRLQCCRADCSRPRQSARSSRPGSRSGSYGDRWRSSDPVRLCLLFHFSAREYHPPLPRIAMAAFDRCWLRADCCGSGPAAVLPGRLQSARSSRPGAVGPAAAPGRCPRALCAWRRADAGRGARRGERWGRGARRGEPFAAFCRELCVLRRAHAYVHEEHGLD